MTVSRMPHISSKTAKVGLAVSAILSLFLGSTAVLASAPQFDTGSELSTESPYQNAQKISGSVFENRSIYGKLEGQTPIDIYTFTPEKDGDQPLELLTRQTGKALAADSQPVLILADPTSATTADNISLPTPGDNYHFALIHQETAAKSYTEPVLLQQFTIVADQVLSLQKGKTYYFIVAPSSSSTAAAPYVIRFGNGKSWTAKDFFKSFGGWVRLQSNDYANSSPFAFPTSALGLLALLLGFSGLAGLILLQEILALRANKNKGAGYLLIKLQPFSRVIIWVATWMLILGEYVLFNQRGWAGVPFVLLLISIPLVANMLYVTFGLSRRIDHLEVTKKEATIPLALRKRWFFSTLVSILTFVAFAVYLTMYLSTK